MYKIKNKQTKTKSFQYSTSAVFFTHISICYKLDNSISFLRGNITKLTLGPNLLKKVITAVQLGFSTLPPIKVQREGGKQRKTTNSRRFLRTVLTSCQNQNISTCTEQDEGCMKTKGSKVCKVCSPVFLHTFSAWFDPHLWTDLQTVAACSPAHYGFILDFCRNPTHDLKAKFMITQLWVSSLCCRLSAHTFHAPLLLYVLTFYSKQSTEWLLE